MTNEFIFGKERGGWYNNSTKTQEYLHQTTLRNKFFKNAGSGPEDKGFGAIVVGLTSNQVPTSLSYPTVCCDEIFWSSSPGWSISDNLNWIRGSHSLKFGISYFGKRLNDWDYWVNVIFGTQFTRAGSADASRGGDALATFLIGIPSSIRQRYSFTGPDQPLLDWRSNYWGGYVEDKWQVSPKLTLSLGLRYDLPIPVYSANRNTSVMDFSYSGWQLAIPGRAPSVGLHYAPADKNNLAPRASLAYRMKSDLVIRSSYGLFYDAGVGSFMTGINYGPVQGYGDNTFNNATYNVNDDIPYFNFDSIYMPHEVRRMDQFPISTGVGTGYFDVRKNVTYQDSESMVTPYYQRYLVEVQKGLSANTAITLSYIVSHGVKGAYNLVQNSPPYKTGYASSSVINAARPNTTGRWGNVSVVRHGFNTFNNAASFKFQRNLSGGLQVLAHYTFSKTVSTRGGWNYNPKLGRGEASFSHPHRFVSALVYETPWGKSLPAPLRAVLSGWNLSAVTTFESGDALTVTNGVTSARDQETDMLNVSGDANLPGGDRTFYRYFKASVFSAPPQDVKGNAGVGLVRGPGINNWNLSLRKVFLAGERLKVEFRGEMFSAFNHTQWNSVDTTFSDRTGNTFGWVTGARDGRFSYLGLRVSF